MRRFDLLTIATIAIILAVSFEYGVYGGIVQFN